MRKDLEDVLLSVPEEGAYIIRYDDTDMPDEDFVGAGAREAAFKRFDQISDSWNAHLFVKISTNVAKHRDYVPDAVPREKHEHEVRMDQSNDAMAAKGKLILTVSLSTRAEAAEIMQWMYGSDKPMLARLDSIEWNSRVIRQEQWDALQALINVGK